MFTEYLFCLLCTAESNDHAPTHFRNSPNHTVKWAVSRCEMGRFASQFGPFLGHLTFCYITRLILHYNAPLYLTLCDKQNSSHNFMQACFIKEIRAAIHATHTPEC